MEGEYQMPKLKTVDIKDKVWGKKLKPVTIKKLKPIYDPRKVPKGSKDSDGDGVKDVFDCDPYDAKKDGFINKSINFLRGRGFQENETTTAPTQEQQEEAMRQYNRDPSQLTNEQARALPVDTSNVQQYNPQQATKPNEEQRVIQMAEDVKSGRTPVTQDNYKEAQKSLDKTGVSTLQRQEGTVVPRDVAKGPELQRQQAKESAQYVQSEINKQTSKKQLKRAVVVASVLPLAGAGSVAAAGKVISTGIKGYALTRGIRGASAVLAPAEQKVFIKDKQTFQEAIQAGYSKEAEGKGKLRSFAQYVPGAPLIPGIGDKEAFRKGVEEYYKNNGVTGMNLQNAVDAAMRQRKAGLVGEAAGALYVSTTSELIGSKNLAGTWKGGQLPFGTAYKQIGRAGFAEGVGGTLSQQQGRYQNTNLGDAVTMGAVGSVSAGTIGGAIGKLGTSGKAGQEKLAKYLQRGTYVADPYEKPGDILASGVSRLGKRTPKVVTLTPTQTQTKTQNTVNTYTKTTTTTPTNVPTNVETKTSVPTNVPTTTKTTTEVPTQTNTETNTETNVPVESSVPVDTEVPTGVPVPTKGAIPFPYIGGLKNGYSKANYLSGNRNAVYENKILDITKGFRTRQMAPNVIPSMPVNTFNRRQPKPKDYTSERIQQMANKGFGKLKTKAEKNTQLFSKKKTKWI